MPELNDDSRAARHGHRRAASGNDARSERRAFRGAARRRRLKTRLWLVTAPAVAVIAAVVALLVVFGGQDNHPGVIAVTTTAPTEPAQKGTLLVIEQGEDIPLMVLLQSRPSGGVVLAIAGMTLLKTGDSFQLVSAVVASGQRDVLTTALSKAFGAQVDSVARVAWPELRGALAEAAGEDPLPSTLTSAQGEAVQVARAVLALVRAAGGGDQWAHLPLSGDASQLRAAIAAFAAAGGEWLAAAVAGNVVESGGSAFLDPEADAVKALLTATSSEAAVTVEVQNGSGAIGVVDQALTQLKPLGYRTSAAGNSDDFPGVEQTRIEVFTGETDVGARVRDLLGVGIVTEDEAVEPGHVVVVLGKDYNPAPATTGASTGGVFATGG